MNRIELNSMTLDELKNFMIKIDEKSYRGEQVFTYFNRNKNLDINSLNQLSKDLKKKILEISYINRLDIFRRFDSKIDNTKKYLFILEDKNIIESVFMEYKHGNTACISSMPSFRIPMARSISTWSSSTDRE